MPLSTDADPSFAESFDTIAERGQPDVAASPAGGWGVSLNAKGVLSPSLVEPSATPGRFLRTSGGIALWQAFALSDVPASGTNDDILATTAGVVTWQKLVNANVAAAAAIAYSKLALSNSIVSGDIVNGTIVDADINAAAAIAISKLSGYPADASVFLRGDGSWASGGLTVEDRVTASTDVVSTAAETTVYSKSIAANDMGSNKTLRLTMEGDYLWNRVNTDTLTVRAKFGATTWLAVVSPFGNTISASRFAWKYVYEITNLGATNSQWPTLFGWHSRADGTVPTTGIGNWSAANQSLPMGGPPTATPLTEDTTAAKTMAVTVQWSTSSASNSFRLQRALLELI